MVLLFKKVCITKTKKDDHFRMKHNRRRMRFRNNCIIGCRNCPKLRKGGNISSRPSVDRRHAES